MTPPGFRAESPLALAALRIALPAVILISPELWQAPRLAAQPAALRFAPEGLGWLVGRLPIHADAARAAQAVLIVACIVAMLGVAARLAMAVVTVSGLYVFALSQLSGAVIHDMHVFWLSGLLAVSPCADALSLSHWLSRTRRSSPQLAAASSLAYGVPLQFARLLLSVVYLFPGFWKLKTSGLAWITSDNLRNQLYWKWYEHGTAAPLLRVDRLPLVLHAAALAVVVFELGFILLIWTKRGRLWAAAAGCVFHIGTWWFMGITFWSLLACYVVLLDGLVVSHASQPLTAAGSDASSRARSWPAWLVGSLLLLVACVQGARAATQAWPFGCYPTFDRMLGDTIGDLRIEAVRADASSVAIPDGPSTGGSPRSSQGWARAWQLAGLYGARPDVAQLQAYWRDLQHDPRAAAAAQGAHALRFYAATYSVLPERVGQPALTKQLLAELPLP